jgi:hypothetical protein
MWLQPKPDAQRYGLSLCAHSPVRDAPLHACLARVRKALGSRPPGTLQPGPRLQLQAPSASAIRKPGTPQWPLCWSSGLALPPPCPTWPHPTGPTGPRRRPCRRPQATCPAEGPRETPWAQPHARGPREQAPSRLERGSQWGCNTRARARARHAWWVAALAFMTPARCASPLPAAKVTLATPPPPPPPPLLVATPVRRRAARGASVMTRPPAPPTARAQPRPAATQLAVRVVADKGPSQPPPCEPRGTSRPAAVLCSPTHPVARRRRQRGSA